MVRNQATGERLTPRDVTEIATFLKPRCEHLDTFDIAVLGETPSNARTGAETVQPYGEAGATWWIEYEASRKGFEDYRARIRNGPPKI
jgi:hypothetical protein